MITCKGEREVSPFFLRKQSKQVSENTEPSKLQAFQEHSAKGMGLLSSYTPPRALLKPCGCNQSWGFSDLISFPTSPVLPPLPLLLCLFFAFSKPPLLAATRKCCVQSSSHNNGSPKWCTSCQGSSPPPGPMLTTEHSPCTGTCHRQQQGDFQGLPWTPARCSYPCSKVPSAWKFFYKLLMNERFITVVIVTILEYQEEGNPGVLRWY